MFKEKGTVFDWYEILSLNKNIHHLFTILAYTVNGIFEIHASFTIVDTIQTNIVEYDLVNLLATPWNAILL